MTDDWKRRFLKELKETRKTYKDMVDFCADSLIMNNWIVQELQKQDFYFEPYCGEERYFVDEHGDIIEDEDEAIDRMNEGEEIEERYEDIFQYFIIDGGAAERFADYTNEIVIYCERLDLYILCVTHFGTSWDYVPSNWKKGE